MAFTAPARVTVYEGLVGRLGGGASGEQSSVDDTRLTWRHSRCALGAPRWASAGSEVSPRLTPGAHVRVGEEPREDTDSDSDAYETPFLNAPRDGDEGDGAAYADPLLEERIGYEYQMAEANEPGIFPEARGVYKELPPLADYTSVQKGTAKQFKRVRCLEARAPRGRPRRAGGLLLGPRSRGGLMPSARPLQSESSVRQSIRGLVAGRNIADLTVEDVASFLEQMNLSQYQERFREERVGPEPALDLSCPPAQGLLSRRCVCGPPA